MLQHYEGVGGDEQTVQIFRLVDRSELKSSFHCPHFIPFHNITVSAVVMQKNGAGLHQAYSCYWDNAIDNTIVAKWPSEKKKDPNAQMVCIITVFGVAF